jgi:DNA-binding SARP family transcriptional activator/DNA-binding beta-propeller fold protein YncE
MEFRILGPLEVLDHGGALEIGGHKQRALLAVLLLRANEVVSLDTLIDELWGETPPPTAAKTLQAHVSRLRKTFADTSGSGRLETRGQGYLLRVDPGQLDAEVFRSMLEDARSALADGDPQTAAKDLRKALDLWRGSPLADFAYEPFAQTEIARLEELRVAALEERIEADLALGRHAALVPELETLVAGHPLRERLLGQLMLALYRSDRQAEALQAYQRGRQALAQELGLEPSQSLQRLERQILEQDAALTAPARKNRPQFVPATAWRHPRRIVLAGALVLAAAVGAAVFQLTRGEEAIAVAGAVVLDAKTSKVLDALPLGTAPSSVAIGTEDVWVLDADDRTVSQIDAENRHVLRTFSTGSIPTDIAAGRDSIWVANGGETSGGLFPASISRLDPDSGEIDTPIALPRSPGGHLFGVLAGLSRQQIALTHDAVWVINPDQSVSRIDPKTNRVAATVRDVSAENIAAGEGEIWVTEGSTIAQIDPSSNRVSRRIELEVDTLSGLTVGAGAVWVTDPFGGKVWRVSVEPSLVKQSIPLQTWVAAITFADGVVWAANEIADEVYRIDPRTNDASVASGISAPRSIDAADGSVWVTAAAPPSSDAALPSPVCGPLFYSGPGSPDVLLVSDLPLKGDVREVVLLMVQGIRHVLEQREFDAGGYSVGYQSCDSSTAQAGTSDFFRCGLNAKAFARNLRVVAEFGSYFSPFEHLSGAHGERGSLSDGGPELLSTRGGRPSASRRARRVREATGRAKALHPGSPWRLGLRQVRRKRSGCGTSASSWNRGLRRVRQRGHELRRAGSRGRASRPGRRHRRRHSRSGNRGSPSRPPCRARSRRGARRA